MNEPTQTSPANDETRAAWNANATFWDERMGEGNNFVNVLIWPAVERLLPVTPGMRVLDITCGNGLTSRRLAARRYRRRVRLCRGGRQWPGSVHQRMRDASPTTLSTQRTRRRCWRWAMHPFDAAICNMALFGRHRQSSRCSGRWRHCSSRAGVVPFADASLLQQPVHGAGGDGGGAKALKPLTPSRSSAI